MARRSRPTARIGHPSGSRNRSPDTFQGFEADARDRIRAKLGAILEAAWHGRLVGADEFRAWATLAPPDRSYGGSPPRESVAALGLWLALALGAATRGLRRARPDASATASG